MKKLLIAYIMGALMTGAWAVQQANAFNATQESFESLTDGAALDVSDERTDKQWVCEDTDATLKAVAYTDEDKAYTYGTPADNTRATAFGGTQKNYLSIDTGSGKPLWRTLAADGSDTAQSIVADAGYVADALVQFTGTDTAPTPISVSTDSGDSIVDKFILWLESKEENDEQVNTLKVICGQSDGSGFGISGETVEIALDKSVTPGTWARVSVKAIAMDTMGNMGFVVFIDGKAVSATADEYDKIGWFDDGYLYDGEAAGRFAARQLFPCITGQVADITKVGFEGSGKIDDVQILAEADEPEFMKYTEEEPGTETVTVSFQAIGLKGTDTWTADDKEVTVGQAIAEMPSTELTGYTFNGWYTTSTCMSGDEFATETLIEKEMTIYAKFTKNVVSYTVTFAQKGLPEGTAWTAPTIDPVVSGQAISALPDAPVVEGYTASAWQYDNGTAYDAQEITEATTLYVTYTVVETDPDPIAPGAMASFKDATKANTWAANKDNIVTPDVLKEADATVIATYKSYLVGTVTGNDADGYTVTFDIDSTKEAALETALEEVLPKVLDGTEITTAVPGFYYAVKACDTVGGEYAVKGDWAQAGDDGTVTLSVTKTEGKTAEFYKIVVQAVDPNAAK